MNRTAKDTDLQKVLRQQLLERFKKSGAHVDIAEALDGLNWQQVGSKSDGLPYSIWQLAEHIRITQYDILEFSRNPSYQSPEWPEGYWPAQEQPTNEKEWQHTVSQIKRDQDAFIALLTDDQAELLKPFDHGSGQSLFLEALLIIDHNAYHTGQIVLIRKINSLWH